MNDLIENTSEKAQEADFTPLIDSEKKAEAAPAESENAEKKDFIKVSENTAVSHARPIVEGVKKTIKQSRLLEPDMIKDIFFGSPEGESSEQADDFSEEEEEDETEHITFGKKKKKKPAKNTSVEKEIFHFDYMVDPEQALDGYMLFYNEFIKKKNVRITFVLSIISLFILFSIILSPERYLGWLLFLICLSVISMRWINTANAKKEAELSADDVKNDSYHLSFFKSKIIIEASELTGDKLYNYPPVMIRFEDIDLRVIDYDNIYVLIFRKDYIYTVPKNAMTEQMNEAFSKHLHNILGDDYHEFYNKNKN